jgi:hypothetical protein
MSMWEQKLNGAQGRDRTLAYPIEIPSLFEWRLSSIPTSGPGAFFAAGRVRLCAAIPKSCACHALYTRYHQRRVLIQIGLVIQSPPKVEVTRSNRVGRASICWLFRCVPGSLRRPSHQVATAGTKTATSDFFVQHAPGVASAFAYRIFKRRFATCLASPGGLVVMRRARSSAGEHYVDIVGVTGSIPVAPHHQTSEN